MNNIDTLKKYINECNNIVFFGGAGVSTASGIKDFRSKDGLYNITSNAEYMLSHDLFFINPFAFYDFYKNNLNCLDAKPNFVHNYLTKLEKAKKLKAIITQNIDGLHTKANSLNVYELHGSIYRNYCLKCNKEYSAQYVFSSKDIPSCDCGGLIKPDVCLYGESLPEYEFNMAIKSIKECDMLIVAGTSLTVEPASSMINLFKGKYLVIINKDKTKYDSMANLVINDDMVEVFKKL